MRLRTLGDNIPGGALYQLLAPLSGPTRYTHMSAGIEKIFGIPAKRVLDDPTSFWADIVEEDRAGIEEAQKRSAREMTLFDCAFRQRASTGEIKWVHVRSTPRRLDDGSTLWDGVIADITERKRAEEKIRTLNAELERRVAERTAQLEAANKELEAFSYSVSHDLRAPLRHVQGFVEMLAHETGDQLSDKALHCLKTITDASREMGVLIDDLLSFSRMGRVQLRETTVRLDALVQETLRNLEDAQPSRTIVWKTSPLPPVQGDPSMLKLVLANLLGNAVKYTRPRDPAQIEIGCSGEEEGRAILFVRDNGVGFDPHYAHKLFGVFQRLHRADEFEGTGIGLANVRRIIARHGGRTWAEGVLNQGATFYFTLKPAPTATSAI